MELNEEEKRQLFQVDGDCQAKVLDELYMTARFTRNPEQRDMVRGLMAKLRVLSDEQCMDLVKDMEIKQVGYSYPFRGILCSCGGAADYGFCFTGGLPSKYLPAA